jgi:hypothetical protein
VISRMARDVTRHRPAKSFLTSWVTNRRRIVRYVAKAVYNVRKNESKSFFRQINMVNLSLLLFIITGIYREALPLSNSRVLN